MAATQNHQTMISFIASQAGISTQAAEKVFAYYRKNKIIKHNVHDGYRVSHGVFYDREVILNALKVA
jgi:hypothetical protein